MQSTVDDSAISFSETLGLGAGFLNPRARDMNHAKRIMASVAPDMTAVPYANIHLSFFSRSSASSGSYSVANDSRRIYTPLLLVRICMERKCSAQGAHLLVPMSTLDPHVLKPQWANDNPHE
jgi:hypothetical protein